MMTAVARGVMLVLALVETSGHEKSSSSTKGIILSILGREKPWMRKIICVSRLPASFTDKHLSELFVSHGTVDIAWLVRSRITGHSEGYGFVMMGTEQEAQAAVSALSGTMVEGTPVLFLSLPPVAKQNGEASPEISALQNTALLASERICQFV